MVPGRGAARDDRRHLADHRLHRHAGGRVRRVRVRPAPALDLRVPREGPDLPGPALDDRPLRQHRDGRDPRAAGLHGRLPDDDRARHVHHQRHRARDRHAARPLARRLPDGAEGRDEAGLHREPDAVARLVARARDRQEGHRLRPHRPQAEAADHDAAPRAAGRGPDHRVPARHVDERGDPRPLRRVDAGLHPEHAREGPLHPRGRGADRGLQEAAPGRAADARQRAQPAAVAVLRPEALRPDEGRPLQAQPAARRLGAGGRPRPHDRGHPRARAEARRPPGAPRRARGLEGLRGRGSRHLARADPRRARRVRALRQPAAPHDGRADPGGVPRRPLPHGARRARADDDRGRRHDHAADDHQHPSGRRGAQGVLRLLAALAVPRPDELAAEPHAPPPPVGARRGRPDPRARADRGARRPPDPLRPDVPDRDAGGPEHRPHRRARVVRHGLRVRLHPDALPRRREGEGLRRDHLPRRRPGGAVHDRAGVGGGRPEDGQVRQRAGALPLRSRRGRDRSGGTGRLHGRLAGADRLGRDGADPVPRAQRRQPGADGREHADGRPCR